MLNQLTILPGERGRRIQFRGFGQMQPTGEVKAYPLGLSAGPAEDDSTVVLHPLSCLVEERLLGVVGHAVRNDEVEVSFKLLKAPVTMSVDVFPHGGKVHGVFDVVQVVRNLQGDRGDMSEATDSLSTDLQAFIFITDIPYCSIC